MDNQDVRVIKEIYELLNSAINDKRQIYVHLVEEGNQNGKRRLIVNNNYNSFVSWLCTNRKQFRVGGIKMNWEIKNILSDMEIIKEKINDVMTSFTWFDEEYFTHEPNHVLNKMKF